MKRRIMMSVLGEKDAKNVHKIFTNFSSVKLLTITDFANII